MKHQTDPLREPKQYVRIWVVNTISEPTSFQASSILLSKFPPFLEEECRVISLTF